MISQREQTNHAMPADRTTAGPRQMIKRVLAVAIVGGPLGYVLGGVASPSINATGQASIDAAATASHLTNGLHMVAFVMASYLLPIGALGLAYLAYPRTPWLATIGGGLAVVGWLPFAALTALDDVTNAMARTPSTGSFAALRDRFATDPVMLSYLIIYILAHLSAYVLLGVALRRGRIIPTWATSAMIASSLLTVIAFALPGSPRVVGAVALSLLVAGSIPAARKVLTS